MNALGGLETMLYLAGPMQGYPDENFPAFHTAALALRTEGYVIVNPAEFEIQSDPFLRSLPMDLQRAMFLRYDLGKLVLCDGIALIDGWRQSRGANVELFTALATGLDVYRYRDEELFKAPYLRPDPSLMIAHVEGALAARG